MNAEQKQRKSFIIMISTIAATGGLLFGFDTGVISGALNFLQEGWQLSPSQLEWVTSSVLVGAVIGAASSGRITDMLGRKKVILITAFIFGAGSIMTGLAPTVELLVVGRIVIGVAIGIASFAVPLYISEISPKKNRGALVTMNQLMITIGILASYISDYVIADDSNLESWRWMFLIGFFPAVVLFIGMLFLPATPRWLMSKNRYAESLAVLKRIEDPALVDKVFEEMKFEAEKSNEAPISSSEILKPWLRSALIIGVGIMLIQQLSGINTIIYYSPVIFKMAGFASNTGSILPAVIVGTVNVLFTVLSIVLLDRVGRRPIYLVGLGGMVIALMAIGAGFFFENTLGDAIKIATVGGMLLYIAFFAVSLGPLGWLLCSEIYPLSIRGVGMSIGSLSNWFFNLIVAFTFLKLVNAFSVAGAFWLYAAIGVLGLVWGYFFIPETKGHSLEDIEEHWRSGRKPLEL
ncbi:MAG: sugar porter family MFS transporter [Myxococcales bacterium]|nr:MAG: sugar porter family MFS transporter [Myxococcales bacterium]